MSNLAQIQADTSWYLQQWPEACLRRRASLSYDAARQGVESWDSSLSFLGDFQALTGREMAAEAGLEHQSEMKVITAHNADVVSHDRIERYDTTGTKEGTYRVNYPRIHEDHKSLFVFREVQQP